MPINHFSARHFKARHFLAISLGGISVVITTGGGGGGPYPYYPRGSRGGVRSGQPGMFYTPRGRFNPQSTKIVTVRVDFKNGKQWKREYIVGTDRADYIIAVSNWINAIQTRFAVGIDSIKRVGNKVSAMFTRDDK